MGRFQLCTAAATGTCLAAFTMSSGAETRLDQINEIYSGSGPEARVGRMLAQTFTVGITGTLAYVDMWLWDSGRPATDNLFVEVWATTSGLPQGGALAQVTLRPEDVQDVNNRVYTRTDFTGAGLSVAAGDALAIVLRTEASADPGGYDWWGNSEVSDGVYSRGNGFHSFDGGVTWEQIAEPDWDYMFKTYVNVTPETLLSQLLTDVTGVGPGKSLANKVALAQTYYAVPDIQATCAVLTDFVNEVKALAGKKKLTAAQATKFTSDANAIMTAIGCN